MLIRPNHPRLRIVALAAWLAGAYCLTRNGMFSLSAPALIALTISMQLLGFILIALGVAFWLLSADQHAGVVFDSKGLLLNLGNSSSFIAWETIERAGVSYHRSQLLALGSARQFGIALNDPTRYIQSYEERLPAGNSMLARTMRLLDRFLRPFQRTDDQPLVMRMRQNRERTGFDVLIPETFLGGRADNFAQLVDSYRNRVMAQRRSEASV